MDNFFSFYLNHFSLALQGSMHLIFTGRLTGKKPKLWHFLLYLSLLFLIEQTFTAFSITEIPALGAELFALYAIHRFAVNNPPSISFTSSALAIYIAQLSFGITNSIEALLLPYFLGTPLFYLLLFFMTLFAYLLCACCYKFILNKLSFKESSPSPYLWLLLLPVLFFFAAELYLLQTAYSHAILTISFKESQKHFTLLSMQILGLAALLSTQYAYQHICQSFQTQAALASLTQAAQAQKTYIAEAQMRYEQTKSFRHDINNHLSVLGGLLNQGKTTEAKHYLQKLDHAAAMLSFPYQTGNPVVDILLSEKLSLAETQGINTEVSFTLPNPWALDDFDLCVIFSNALDNAVEACRQSGKETPWIHLTGKQQGSFYLLELTNTCSPSPLPPMGIGLANIHAAAKKYHGTVSTEKKGDCFHLHILLNSSIHPDSHSGQTS